MSKLNLQTGSMNFTGTSIGLTFNIYNLDAGVVAPNTLKVRGYLYDGIRASDYIGTVLNTGSINTSPNSGVRGVSVSFFDMPVPCIYPNTEKASVYFEISGTETARTIPVNGTWSGLQVNILKKGTTLFNESTGHYSYGTFTIFTDYNKISLFQNGTLYPEWSNVSTLDTQTGILPDTSRVKEVPFYDTIISGNFPNTNYGTFGTMVFGRTIFPDDTRALITIPSGTFSNNVTVRNSILRMSYGTNTFTVGAGTYTVYIANKNVNNAQVTWNSYATGSVWGTAGGDFITSATFSTFTTNGVNSNYYTDINIKEIIGTVFNNGSNVSLIIKSLGAIAPQFYTNEFSNPTLFPKLWVDSFIYGTTSGTSPNTGTQQFWHSLPLFMNRPPYLNAPVQINAGFRGTWGTESVPVGNYRLQELNASANNIQIELKATDNWTYYGDRLAGTWNGTGFVSTIVENCLKYNGFLYEDYLINTIETSYANIPVNNRQYNNISVNTGGFGVYWGKTTKDWGNRLISFIDPVGEFYDVFSSDTNSNYLIENNTLRTKNHSFITDILPVTIEQVTGYNSRTMQDTCIGINEIDNNYIIGFLTRVDESHGLGGTIEFELQAINRNLPEAYANYPEQYQYPITLVNSTRWENGSFTGLTYDSINKCGYLFEGTSKRVCRFGTDGNITATFTLGTQDSITKMTTMLQPISNARGTLKSYLLVAGVEGGTNYIYRYSGTGAFTFLDKAPVYSGTATNWTRGIGVTYENNLPFVWSAGGVYVEGGRDGDPNRDSLLKVGQFGFDFQHPFIYAGTVLKNGVDIAGSWTIASSGSSAFVMDNMVTSLDAMTSSYAINSIPLNINCGTWKFKDLMEKLSNLALGCCYFDTQGRFVFADKRKTVQIINVSSTGQREYDGYLNELSISGNTGRNINKVKNQITIIGTTGAGTSIYIDLQSQAIYGTRKLAPYKSDFIKTTADRDTYGSYLLSYLKDIKTTTDVEIPFHPEIELLDGFSFQDIYNSTNTQSIIIKKTSIDLKTFKNSLTGETFTIGEK